MKNFKTIFNKKSSKLDVYLYSLFDLQKVEQAIKLLRLVDLFDGKYLLGNCTTDKDEKFANYLKTLDSKAQIVSEKKSKYCIHLFVTQFKNAKELFKWFINSGDLLAIYIVDEELWEQFLSEKGALKNYNAFFLINDNDESILSFNSSRNQNVILDEIKKILD